jgi:hypothetical protein
LHRRRPARAERAESLLEEGGDGGHPQTVAAEPDGAAGARTHRVPAGYSSVILAAVIRAFTNVLIFLALTAEIQGITFHGEWATPMTGFYTFMFSGMPGVHLIPWDVLVVGTLIAARKSERSRGVPAIARTIKISWAALALTWVWGMLRGGSPYQTIWQLHWFVMGLVFAFLVSSSCRSYADAYRLGRIVVFAAVYRSFILLLFYFLVARHLPEEPPVLTDHADSVLFAGAITLLAVHSLEQRTWSSFGRFLGLSIPILVAIALNGRRIAWLELGLTPVVTYLLLPKGVVKRKITRVMLLLSPLVIAYIVAGWGRPVGIFKPVGSISTMFGENQDVSSIMRDIENYNLMRTLKVNPLLGVGWGNQYVEEVQAYDISGIFPQYRYLPHNSLLGAVAFTGMLGFGGIWLIVPMATLLHAKVYSLSTHKIARAAALGCLLVMITCVIEMWGDVGFQSLTVNTMMGIAIGLAARLPVLTELWPPAPRAQRPPPSPALPATTA